MSKLPKWIKSSERWPMESDNRWPRQYRACGIGCDMGKSGRGPEGQHDPDCKIVKYVRALEIAWEELENVDKVCVCDAQTFAKQAMRRIEELGK